MRRLLLYSGLVWLLAASLVAESNLRIVDVGLHGYSGPTTTAARLQVRNPSLHAQTLHLQMTVSGEDGITIGVTTDVLLGAG
jgi:hypothetical protein